MMKRRQQQMTVALVALVVLLSASAHANQTWPAPSTGSNTALRAARQQLGGSLAQHLGQGWSFTVETCELKQSQGGTVTTAWMREATGIFSLNLTGAWLDCSPGITGSGLPLCITRQNAQGLGRMQLFNPEELSWRTTRAAHLAYKVHAPCQLGAQATAEQVRAASETNGSGSKAYVHKLRSGLLGQLRSMAPMYVQSYSADTCVVGGQLADGARVQIPLRKMQMRPPTQTAAGRAVNMQCSGSAACIAVAGGGARAQASWLVAGTSAQQDNFVRSLTELQRLCISDDELPPVIN